MRSTAFEDFRALVIFRPVSWGSCAFHLLFCRLLLEFHSIVVRFKRLASCHECIHPDWIGLRRRRKLFSPGLKNTLPAFGKAKPASRQTSPQPHFFDLVFGQGSLLIPDPRHDGPHSALTFVVRMRPPLPPLRLV